MNTEREQHVPAMVAKPAMRFNKGKMDWTYLFEFPKALGCWVKVCIFGEFKYGRLNFKSGGKDDLEYWKCLMRHVQKAYEARFNPDVSELDGDSKLHHLGHAVWNAVALMELNRSEDDLWGFDTYDEFLEHCRLTAEKFAAQRAKGEAGTEVVTKPDTTDGVSLTGAFDGDDPLESIVLKGEHQAS